MNSLAPNPPDDLPPADELDRAIRHALSEVEPPPNLFGKILAAAAEHDPVKAVAPVAPLSWWASIVAALGRFVGPVRLGFEDFRIEVATVKAPQLIAARLPLDLRSAEIAELMEWLGQARAPRPDGNEFRAPGGVGAVGCKTFEWLGQRYSVICFYDQGRHGVHLFSISGRSLRTRPAEGPPEWLTIGGLPTASWSHSEMSFVLVAGTPRADLRKYF